MTDETITSAANPLVKRIARLCREAGFRRETGLCVCEGEHLLGEALRSGAAMRELLYDETAPAELVAQASAAGVRCVRVTQAVSARCSSVISPQGMIFTCDVPAPAEFTSGTRFLLLDGISDPGNLGTILRSADAFALDGVLLCNACADAYSPKVLRSTMGAIFRIRLARCTPDGAAELMHRLGVPLCGSALARDSKNAAEADLSRACVAIGSEAAGLSREVLALCGQKLIIPMPGAAESLNAAVAAGIFCWLMSAKK